MSQAEAQSMVRSDNNKNNKIDIDNNDEETALSTTTTTTTSTSSTSTLQKTNKRRSSCFSCLRQLFGLLLLCLIVFVIIDSLDSNSRYCEKLLDQFMAWMEHHPIEGSFCFIAVYFLSTICFIPTTFLMLGAGYIYSATFQSLKWAVVLGVTVVFIGAFLGGLTVFSMARWLWHDSAHRFLHNDDDILGGRGRPYIYESSTLHHQQYRDFFRAMDAATEHDGLRIMILLRLSPIIPFNVTNVLAGVFSVTTRQFLLSFPAVLPVKIVLVFVGAAAESLAESATKPKTDRHLTITFIVLGVIFALLALFVVLRDAKHELQRMLDERRRQLQQQEQSTQAAARTTESDSRLESKPLPPLA